VLAHVGQEKAGAAAEVERRLRRRRQLAEHLRMPLFLEESRKREAVANRVLRRELLVELDLDLLMRFRLGHGARFEV
jgi:hypothetical protein